MKRWLAFACVLTAGVAWSACGISGDSSRKIVITENVCAGVDFLRMKLGEDATITLDNTRHSEHQSGLSVILNEFPVTVIGELPQGSQVGTNFTSLRLIAAAGEKDSVTVRPLFSGQYTGQCNVAIDASSGGTGFQYELKFQIDE